MATKQNQARNGIQQPRDGSLFRIIWNMLDTAESEVTSKHIPQIAEKTGLNETTVRIQYYRHRRYNGKFGRQS